MAGLIVAFVGTLINLTPMLNWTLIFVFYSVGSLFLDDLNPSFSEWLKGLGSISSWWLWVLLGLFAWNLSRRRPVFGAVSLFAVAGGGFVHFSQGAFGNLGNYMLVAGGMLVLLAIQFSRMK
ncbi:hypothetical protein [Shimia sediminis]|uniref:hypothetical protein n=1 Tax=Shimia sediminis TaxID=2497945 RepID=UPI000F8C9D59|nr:hypothetical protein [Shimia sediminis]